jgi:hypothetical protein
MQMMRLELVLGCAALAMSTARVAPTSAPTGAPSLQTSQSGEPQAASRHAVLVELFTSEGCSSCPPADDLLRKIDGKHTSNGTLIVGVSEHVTYWDHGGWKDPFDSDTITDRQNQYGERFHLESVYTPQMVVNGRVQLVGSDGKALLQAIGNAQAEPAATVKIVSTTMDGKAMVVVVSVAGELPKHGADLFTVVAQDETTTDVTAGENKGRTLVNAAVARTYSKAATVHVAGETTVRIPLPGDLKTAPESRRHLIVWAQESNIGPVLGVDTIPF